MRHVLLVLLLATGCSKLFGGNNNTDGPDGGFGSSCQASSDCGNAYVCIANSCGEPGTIDPNKPCSATRDCTAGNYCTAAGVCGPGGTKVEGDACTSDGDCHAGLRCNYSGFGGTCGRGGTDDVGATCAKQTDCLPGLYCGQANKCESYVTAFPAWNGPVCNDDGPFRVYFEVPRPGQPPKDFFRLPFPNDVRVDDTGKLDISDFPDNGKTPLDVDLVKLYKDTYTKDFDGFSTTQAISFRFSQDLDFNSTLTGSPVQFWDLTANKQLNVQWTYGSGQTKYSCRYRLVVHSDLSSPLPPKHTFAVIVTTQVKSTGGTNAAPDADLAAILGDTAPSDANLTHAWNVYAPLRAILPTAGLAPTDVAAATVFTTEDSTGHMARLATDVQAQPLPQLKSMVLCDTGVTSPCDDGTPARDCPAASSSFYEIHGTYSVPIYQQGTEPYATPDQGGGITEDSSGTPQVVRTEDVCFALTIPKGASLPAGGWPLVVYEHGTGGSFRSFIDDGIAMQAAANGGAVFSMDAVEHGARRGGSTTSPDDLVFNPLNPEAARDNFLQGAVDILQALRLPGNVTIDAGSSPTGQTISFDSMRAVFFGHSQGSTEGELALPWAPVNATILGGAGTYLTYSLLDKTSPVNIKDGMSFLLQDALDPNHPVMILFQSFFDRSDPQNTAPLLVRSPIGAPKSVFFAFGDKDTYTPERTLVANAQAIGLAPVNPVLVAIGNTMGIDRPISGNLKGGAATGAVFEYAPSGYDGHFVDTMNPSAVTDWTAFLTSYWSTLLPSVP